MAALPASVESERALRLLRNEIVEMEGTAQLIDGRALAGDAELVEMFNAARDEEYTEIIERCGGFLAEIRTETAAGKFTFAELEENDEDLTKLRGWLAKVAGRDRFAASRRAEATAAVEQAAAALEGFAEQVYTSETGGETTVTEYS